MSPRLTLEERGTYKAVNFAGSALTAIYAQVGDVPLDEVSLTAAIS